VWAPGPVEEGDRNLTPTGIRSPDRPGHTESLYRLRYSDPPLNVSLALNNIAICWVEESFRGQDKRCGPILYPEEGGSIFIIKDVFSITIQDIKFQKIEIMAPL
jgi:hypothetical protein